MDTPRPPEAQETPTRRAVLAAGGRRAIADALEITPEAVRQWEVNNSIPPKWLARVEQLSGVPRAELRPDIFGQAA